VDGEGESEGWCERESARARARDSERKKEGEGESEREPQRARGCRERVREIDEERCDLLRRAIVPHVALYFVVIRGKTG
jgi:hypothetical protein